MDFGGGLGWVERGSGWLERGVGDLGRGGRRWVPVIFVPVKGVGASGVEQ